MASMEQLIAILSILGGMGATLAKTFKYVHEGELGIKLRFGKALRIKKTGEPRIIAPGFVMLFPFAETLRTHHVRQQTIRFIDQDVMINGGLSFKVAASLIFKVKNIYRALFEIDDLDSSLADLGMGILREEFSAREFSNIGNTKEISAGLLLAIREKAEEWGVEITRFSLTNCSPTTESAHITNVVMGAEMKCGALEVAAKKMGLKNVSELNSTLGAVLVGMPFQATTNQSFNTHNEAPEQDHLVIRKLDQVNEVLKKVNDKIGG